MSTNKEAATKEFKDASAEVVALSDSQIALIAGVPGARTIPAEWYENNLPDGLTKEGYLKFAEHNSNVAAATMRTLGLVSITDMKADKALEKATLDVPTFGKDKFSATFQRSNEVVVPSPDGGTAGTKTVFGRAGISFDQYGLGRRGQVAVVKNFLSAKAEAELGY